MASPLDSDALRRRIAEHSRWYHRITLAPGVVTPGVQDSAGVLAHLDQLGLPADCSGLSVLDIGVRDGFFAFELERRGAEVTGIDIMPPTETGFAIAAEILGSGVKYLVGNVYDLAPERLGTSTSSCSSGSSTTSGARCARSTGSARCAGRRRFCSSRRR